MNDVYQSGLVTVSGYRPTLFVLIVFFALMQTGCYPTTSKNHSSTVAGTITENGVPVAKVEVYVTSGRLCVRREHVTENMRAKKKIGEAGGEQPNEVLHLVKDQPDAIANEEGRFERKGDSGVGFVRMTEAQRHVNHICLKTPDGRIFESKMAYFEGHDKRRNVDVTCDLNVKAPCKIISCEPRCSITHAFGNDVPAS